MTSRYLPGQSALIWLILIALPLLLAACASAPGDAGHKADPDLQLSAPGAAQCMASTPAGNRALAEATNRIRQAQGLAPVTPNAILGQAAAAHACDMAQRGRMTHRGSTSSGPGPRVKALGYRPILTAENIAAGPFSQDRVLREWAASPGHLANILVPQLREVGLGRATGTDGRTVFWAAVYGAPKAATRPP